MPLGPRLRLAKSTRLKSPVFAVPGRATGHRVYGFTDNFRDKQARITRHPFRRHSRQRAWNGKDIG